MAMIVIAEDEFLLAQMLTFMLEDAGHTVRPAAHGVAALEMIRQDPPALVVADFMMPLMTGLELAEKMRADPALKHIPIILVSGAQGAIGRARPDAFDAVLDKPYDPHALLETIERLLNPR
jgi:CheY-like chemotaxis protein